MGCNVPLMRWFEKCLLVALGIAIGADAAARGPLEPPGVEDFTRVRVTWSNERWVQPYWEVAAGRNAIYKSFQAKDYADVVSRSAVWLRKFPIDAPVHFMRAQAMKAQADYAGFATHLYWYGGLLSSIHASGDGGSPQTAIKVVALREEHFLVRDLGGNVASQDLVEIDGVTYHKVRAEFGSGARTLYFDITIPFRQLQKNLRPSLPGTGGAKPGS